MKHDRASRLPLNPMLVRLWPLWIALTVFAVLLVRMLLKVIDLNDGNLIYSLDDAYIHMSIARNIVEHGVWGVTQYAYTSSSSSPFWTLLLALTYAIFGANEYSPFTLNIAASVFLLGVSYAVMRRHHIPAYAIAGGLGIIVVFLPLNAYIFTGLEHVLHAALAVAFLALGAEAITRTDPLHWNERDAILLYLTGAMLAFTRYEGLFIVAAICGLLVLRGRLFFALLLGMMSALPVAAYGLIAMNNGWPFLPVSVVLKSEGSLDALRNIDSIGAAFDWVGGVFTTLNDSPLFLATAGFAVVLLILRVFVPPPPTDRAAMRFDTPSVMLVAVALVILMHLRLLTDPGIFDRYMAYLVTISLIAITTAGARYLPRSIASLRETIKPAAITGIALVAVGFVVFGWQMFQRWDDLRTESPMLAGTNNIYLQQYQMARFLQTHYNDATVAANDIGAITYFTDIRLVDLFGLGSIEVAETRMNDAYTPELMRQLAADAGAEIAIAYRHWITELLVGAIPDGWVTVGEWGTPNVVVLGGETVTFYALNDAAVAPLTDALWDFGNDLPALVFQQHFLVEGGG